MSDIYLPCTRKLPILWRLAVRGQSTCEQSVFLWKSVCTRLVDNSVCEAVLTSLQQTHDCRIEQFGFVASKYFLYERVNNFWQYLMRIE